MSDFIFFGKESSEKTRTTKGPEFEGVSYLIYETPTAFHLKSKSSSRVGAQFAARDAATVLRPFSGKAPTVEFLKPGVPLKVLSAFLVEIQNRLEKKS